MNKLLLSLAFTLTLLMAEGQDLVLYKEIDSVKLYLEVITPANQTANAAYPAIIFFFGGGWNGGDRDHFRRQAEYFAERGLVCFLADYRTRSKHGTTPFESLRDAKSAMRFLRANAAMWQVDDSKIIAGGGSAGGHLAAATALITKFNDTDDDLTVSPVPNALVLFNPVVDNGPGGYGYKRIGEVYRDFSPLHNIMPGAPPTLFLLGTQDNLIPVETGEYFKVVMEKVGSRCDLELYEGAGHGFFNYGREGDFYDDTLLATDEFIQSLGYLQSEGTVKN